MEKALLNYDLQIKDFHTLQCLLNNLCTTVVWNTKLENYLTLALTSINNKLSKKQIYWGITEGIGLSRGTMFTKDK